MKTISKNIDLDNDLTLFRVDGKVSHEEIVEAIRDFYDGLITSNVIWDLTKSDLRHARTQDILELAALSADYATRRPSGKTAVVGANDLTFGLARMYEQSKESNDLPFETRTFRNIDDAYTWIREHWLLRPLHQCIIFPSPVYKRGIGP